MPSTLEWVLLQWPIALAIVCCHIVYFLAKRNYRDMDKAMRRLILVLMILPLFYDPAWLAALILTVYTFISFNRIALAQGDSSVSGAYAVYWFIYFSFLFFVVGGQALYRWAT